MKSLKSAIAGAAALAVVGTGLLLGATGASAATPGFEPDPNASNGSIVFYDAAGNVITGGNNLSHLFDFAAGSSAATRSATNLGTTFFAFPDHTKLDSNAWTSVQSANSTNFPVASPASVAALPARVPVNTAGATEANLAAPLAVNALDTTPGYLNIIQVRLKDSGAGVGNGFQSKFWATDIQIDQAAGTWTQVYPAPAAVIGTSISAITASPASPAAAGTTSVALSATLSAADSSHPAGSVHLFNGATDLGAATFDAATGAISATATVADSSSYGFQFKYTPAAGYSASSSAVLNYSVNGPAAVTTTVLSGPTSTTLGSAVTIHADVKSGTPAAAVPAAAGSVQFSVAGVASGSPVPLTATGADFSYNPSATGSKTITAAFVPASGQNYAGSSDTTGVTVVTSAPAYNPDPQTVVVTVPTGTLVISTPYTASHPFNLGTMTLDANGSGLTASAPFGTNATAATDPGTLDANPAAAVTNGVTITDTRPGSTGWTASAQTSDFTGPAGNTTPIPGNNLSFTGVTPKYLTGNHLQAGSVIPSDITAFKTAKKPFATTTQGPGTVNIYGTLGLTAVTSTLPGLYTATVTFTIA